jgi:hypothetical protein
MPSAFTRPDDVLTSHEIDEGFSYCLVSNFCYTRSLLEIFLAHILSYFLALWESKSSCFYCAYSSKVHVTMGVGHAFIAIKRALHFQDTLA